jgi:hypothetical protein
VTLFTFLAITAAAAAPSAPRPPSPPLAPGAEVLNFSLIDYHGKNHDLRRTNAKVVVLFFTTPGCPIARQNAPKLQALADRFREQGVVAWMVNAAPQTDPGDTQLDLLYNLGGVTPRNMLGDRYPIKGMRGLVDTAVIGDPDTLRLETLETLFGPYPLPPILRDRHQLVTRYLGVTRTCDTIAIDTGSNTILYRGAIDDQYTEGARKPKPTSNYLADALEQHLAGKPVATNRTKPHGCAISFDDDNTRDDQVVSYTKLIAPLLQKRCVACHSPGNLGPFAMTSLAKVKGQSAMIREVLLDRRMPPWHADPQFGHFANDPSLTGPEARALTRWIDQGCPNDLAEGVADPLATPPPPAPDWPLGKPDFVVRIPRQQIPATGTVDYRYLDADFEMPRDAWLRAAPTRPGNAKIVHHVIVRIKYPLGATGPGESYLFTTWVPGLAPYECPPDTGLFVPKGARFNFEIHYTTNGEPQTDADTAVGLYLAKTPPKLKLETRASETRHLDIPPNAPDAQHTTTYAFKRDAVLYELAPHMHTRGSHFRFDLLLPDGRRETLLSVPNYDFNWQTAYWLKTPRKIPAGSWLLCTGGFDNSKQNPNNPDPTTRVRWGPQSWNEMFMGFFTVAEPRTDQP